MAPSSIPCVGKVSIAIILGCCRHCDCYSWYLGRIIVTKAQNPHVAQKIWYIRTFNSFVNYEAFPHAPIEDFVVVVGTFDLTPLGGGGKSSIAKVGQVVGGGGKAVSL